MPDDDAILFRPSATRCAWSARRPRTLGDMCGRGWAAVSSQSPNPGDCWCLGCGEDCLADAAGWRSYRCVPKC
jgi:hypothetical protein